ncbi:putative transcriptional regulatory protein C15D4.02 [Fusarium austroafricanum]|uniref:Putative transcriptional regulatory protein C15D4.02 n=1 Tax=Fusarium austroafricanum TaxID=2364996 RepID=A0A8H4NU42_9HYPO|nr:putative transcriptional regulatory protein C15D4.02 [Fusarium austroafricanum]
MTITSTETAKPKRTRTNVKQSKFGCFTCKARRVKCDEAKPSCNRCLTSKRECQGYPRGAYGDSSPNASSDTSSSLTSASSSSTSSPPSDIVWSLISSHPSDICSSLISLAFTPEHLSNPYVNLGCTVLVQSPRRARNDNEHIFWSHSVPQLSQSIPSVRAAIETFGVSYNEYVLKVPSPRPGFETARRYAQALRLVQDDLATMQHGPVPCVIACLLLGLVEALQQRLNKGLLHLQGALSLMKSGVDKKMLAGVDYKGLISLLHKLDLHVATYGIANPPNLPLKPFIMENVLDWRAHAYKYTSRRAIPPELLVEQGRQLSNLKLWLSRNRLPSIWDCESHESLVVLRAQCLAALINAANILEPRETAYDCFGPEFQEIVTLIEALLESKSRHEKLRYDSPGPLPSFIPEMGIIHPLYFTAKKYRSPHWRRRALNLILKCGNEGPWGAETEGSLVAGIIKSEEGAFDKESLNLTKREDTTNDGADSIPEERRLNACWACDPERENGEPTPTTRKRYTQIMMFKCLDMEGLLRDKEGQKPKDFAWLESERWEGWTEPLEMLF